MNAIEMIKKCGLKVTTSRIAVLEALFTMKDHPRADQIIEKVQKLHPQIAIGTIYKSLEVLSDHCLIKKVKTEKDIMRYEALTDSHHHLYETKGDRIEDYFDDELDQLIREHFNKKHIPGFEVDEFRLHIKGQFKNQQK